MKEKQSLTRFAGVPFAGGAFSLWLLLYVVSFTGRQDGVSAPDSTHFSGIMQVPYRDYFYLK
ncbi:hypothetical protein IMSAG013_00321 [Clostridiales bacterium]|nr:hypothetical protein IMSAG013_00321 [Clostridiales bacterium]